MRFLSENKIGIKNKWITKHDQKKGSKQVEMLEYDDLLPSIYWNCVLSAFLRISFWDLKPRAQVQGLLSTASNNVLPCKWGSWCEYCALQRSFHPNLQGLPVKTSLGVIRRILNLHWLAFSPTKMLQMLTVLYASYPVRQYSIRFCLRMQMWAAISPWQSKMANGYLLSVANGI